MRSKKWWKFYFKIERGILFLLCIHTKKNWVVQMIRRQIDLWWFEKQSHWIALHNFSIDQYFKRLCSFSCIILIRENSISNYSKSLLFLCCWCIMLSALCVCVCSCVCVFVCHEMQSCETIISNFTAMDYSNFVEEQSIWKLHTLLHHWKNMYIPSISRKKKN